MGVKTEKFSRGEIDGVKKSVGEKQIG